MVEFTIKTTARQQMVNIDQQVNSALASAGATNGTALIFCPHTTAAITINENADPDVCHDLISVLGRLVPKAQDIFRHSEGNSDAHIFASLIGASSQVIVQDGKMVLGTWQSLYFVELDGARTRKVFVKFVKG